MMPAALNVRACDCAITGLNGVIAIEASTGVPTLTVRFPVAPAQPAVIAADPEAVNPFGAASRPVSLTVASVVAEDFHVTMSVKSCVVPSE